MFVINNIDLNKAVDMIKNKKLHKKTFKRKYGD